MKPFIRLSVTNLLNRKDMEKFITKTSTMRNKTEILFIEYGWKIKHICDEFICEEMKLKHIVI